MTNVMWEREYAERKRLRAQSDHGSGEGCPYVNLTLDRFSGCDYYCKA